MVEARGTRAGGEPARIRIQALGRSSGGEKILATKEVDLARETATEVLTFRTPGEGQLTIPLSGYVMVAPPEVSTAAR